MRKSSLQLILLFLMLFCSKNIGAQASKCVHVFYHNANSSPKLELILDSEDVSIFRTPSSRVLVEMCVVLSTNNEKFLEHLMEKGRYTLNVFDEELSDVMQLVCPQNNTLLYVKGEHCTEKVSYVIHVPERIAYVHLNGEVIIAPGLNPIVKSK